MRLVRFTRFFLLGLMLAGLASCGGGKRVLPISVALSPSTAQSVDQGQSVAFTATVANDIGNQGVKWDLSGSGCTGSACGQLTNTTTTSVTYAAPATVSSDLIVTITATSLADETKNATVSVTAVPPPSFSTTSLPNGLNGTPYNQTILATGGVLPYRWSLISGTLPAGLILSSSSGTIQGTPSGQGISNFSIQLADAGSPALTATQALSITIKPPPPLSITTTSMPSGAAGTSYNAPITAAGGVPPLAWSLFSGNLPPGLSLNATSGQVSGTPTAQGGSNFTVQATDSAIPPQSATQPLSITIGPPAPLAITTASLPAATSGVSYNAAVQATGGVSPYTWSITSGNLPSGLSLAASTGIISGTPIAQGSSSFTAHVADSEAPPQSASATYTIAVGAGASNNSLFVGNYVFLFDGFDAQGSLGMGGVFTADGNGNLSNGFRDINRGSGVTRNLQFTGTYSMGSDGRGSFKITVGKVTETYQMVLDSNGNAQFIEFDNTGTRGAGILRKQRATTFAAGNFTGDYAFGFAGFDSAGKREAIAGRFHADGAGTFSQGTVDINDAGTASNVTGVAGAYVVGSNGRGSASLTIPPVTLNFMLYMVAPDEILFLSVDPVSKTNPRISGTASQQAGGPFDKSGLNGAAIASGTGLGSAGASVFLGLFTADGAGNATLTTDENNGGSVTSNPTQSGTYAVDPTGRVAITGLGGRIAALYLVSRNKAFLVGSDAAATSGMLEPQSGGPVFANSSFSGQFNQETPEPAEKQVALVAGFLGADGAGNFSGTQDTVDSAGTQTADQAYTGTYSISSNGRGTLALTPSGSSPQNFILYVVSPKRILLLPFDPGVVHPALMALIH